MRTAASLSLFLLAFPAAHAADVEAGKAKVQSVCAACHGVNGVSVSDTIPNLAGQKPAYLETQLKALREGVRKNPIMNPIAGQLKDDEIANVAAYFASLPGGASTAKSAFLPNVAKSNVAFPANYKSTFTKYHTINFPATRQVRYYYANPVALQAAKDGKDLPNGSVLFAEVYSAKVDAEKKPVTGSDGFFVADQLTGYAAMEREAGWGKEIPDMLRNDEWNYAVFTADKQHRPGINQAECFACHKPLDKASYTFTLKELTEVAKKK
ncbi:MAG TPA: cytochrome P460 family protein [Burkholderiaceae bacterium]|nr:cytochrome P460 family protein [Burkholderiaceae bacterium]